MYKETPSDSKVLPKGIPYIISNEIAERYSFYGMKAILAVFIVQYLHLMGDNPTANISEAKASEWVHSFSSWVYFTPLLGALLADFFFGKYPVIIVLSIVYCLGHAVLALMGIDQNTTTWLFAGLALITLGAGGIKPCVSAHVGDQFGKNNQHLLSQVFNWFYFSINLGAFFSSLVSPWVLRYYGPHWAFGIPGVLMAIATVCFWMGRHKFIHIPPQGKNLFKELKIPGTIPRILKICSIFIFVSIFWALFDQNSTSWVFQAQDMETNILGIPFFPSQFQMLNPIMILILIPLFTFIIYPAINKIFHLTPLRKIGIGLFIMVAAFSLVTLVQTWIDAGQRPSIGWQALSYLLLTISEVMVSIVCLEFAYTQAPKSLKSFIMSLFLLTVFFGNQITSKINKYIQIDSPLTGKTEQLAGLDGELNTSDDINAVYKENLLKEISFDGDHKFNQALTSIQPLIENDQKLPANETVSPLISSLTDSHGNPIHYEILNSKTARLRSAGADKNDKTKWDTGIMITLNEKEDPDAKKTWLQKRQEQLGIENKNTGDNFKLVSTKTFIGGSSGMNKLEGATYFKFFTYLMLGTAVLFIPFSLIYKYNTVK